MADLTTSLSKFLNDLMAGTLGDANAISRIRVGDGTAAAPSYSFASDTDTGRYHGGPTELNAFYESIGGVAKYRFTAGDFIVPSDGKISWNNGANVATGTPDVSLSRGAANRLTLATGDVLNLAPTAFASLPAAAEGNLACVTDSSTATWGATITGGGANNVLAFHNGTNWVVAGA